MQGTQPAYPSHEPGFHDQLGQDDRLAADDPLAGDNRLAADDPLAGYDRLAADDRLSAGVATEVVGAESAVAAHRAGRREQRETGPPARRGPPWAVAVGLGATACGATVNLALTGGLSLFFAQCLVLSAFVVAFAVSRQGMFTAAVLPPLAFLAVLVALAAVDPRLIGATGSFARTVLAGLVAHAGALVTAHAIALATVLCRVATMPARPKTP